MAFPLDIRCRKLLAGVAFAAASAALFLPSSASAAVPIEGTYAGSGKKVTGSIAVAGNLTAKLSYSLSGRCGSAKGSMTLKPKSSGAYKGVGAAGKRSVAAKLRLSADGTQFAGKLRQRTQPKQKRGKKVGGCSTKRTFTAALDEEHAFVPIKEVGHYVGASEAGRAISFDVAYDAEGNTATISNITADADAECWEDLDDDGTDDTIVAHLAGFSGEIDSTGEFSVEHADGEDVEYIFEGSIKGQQATVNVLVAGFFDPDGTPNPLGPLSCDSWGADYHAVAQ